MSNGQFTEQQLHQVKLSLMQNFVKLYAEFLKTLDQFPADQSAMQVAKWHFNVGFICAKDAIANLQPVPVEPPVEAQAEPDCQEPQPLNAA